MKAHAAIVLAVIFSVSAVGFAKEKKIQRSDLPPAVEKALQPQIHGATIKGFATEKEDGQVLYEAELMVNGHSRDINFDSNGKVVEIEEEVAFDTLPADVKSALTAKAGDGKIALVESLTKQDKLVAYEAQVDKKGKRSEIQVGPKGEKLSHEE